MKFYLAGPMTGYEDYNFPAFDKAAAKLRAEGHEVFSPADADRERWGSMDEIKKHASYRVCLSVDLNWILNEAEGIALMPGWEYSSGAFSEWSAAKALKLKFRYLTEAECV